jgi:hypothetical protein
MPRSLLLPLLLFFPFVSVPQRPDLATGTPAVPQEFTEGVDHYAGIHRGVAASLGQEILCANAEELQRQTWAFAAAIRAAMPNARAGDIFSPDVAKYFRGHIATVVRETRPDIATLLEENEDDDDDDEEEEEEEVEEPSAPEVNAAFPWNAGGFMWPSMLWRLPSLPEELEYRFVGRDLVLLDVRANLVVDVLQDALVEGNTAPVETPRRPCDVHPELPACWT